MTGDEGRSVGGWFVLAPESRKTITDADGGFLDVGLQFFSGVGPRMDRLMGWKLLGGNIAIKHQNLECTARDREGLGAFVAAGIDANAHTVGTGLVVNVQGNGGNEEVELVDGGFGFAGWAGTADEQNPKH